MSNKEYVDVEIYGVGREDERNEILFWLATMEIKWRNVAEDLGAGIAGNKAANFAEAINVIIQKIKLGNLA